MVIFRSFICTLIVALASSAVSGQTVSVRALSTQEPPGVTGGEFFTLTPPAVDERGDAMFSATFIDADANFGAGLWYSQRNDDGSTELRLVYALGNGLEKFRLDNVRRQEAQDFTIDPVTGDGYFWGTALPDFYFGLFRYVRATGSIELVARSGTQFMTEEGTERIGSFQNDQVFTFLPPRVNAGRIIFQAIGADTTARLLIAENGELRQLMALPAGSAFLSIALSENGKVFASATNFSTGVFEIFESTSTGFESVIQSFESAPGGDTYGEFWAPVSTTSKDHLIIQATIGLFDEGLMVRVDDELHQLMRTRLPAPEIPGVTVASMQTIASDDSIAILVQLTGAGVNPTNDFAIYLVPIEADAVPRLVLREGDTLSLGDGAGAGVDDDIVVGNAKDSTILGQFMYLHMSAVRPIAEPTFMAKIDRENEQISGHKVFDLTQPLPPEFPADSSDVKTTGHFTNQTGATETGARSWGAGGWLGGSVGFGENNTAIFIVDDSIPGEIEVCDDGIDNNDDGLVDCEDLACKGARLCIPEDCDDGEDNDGDGQIDCEDDDCCSEVSCFGLAICAEEFICDDGFDNDLDGKYDCLDEDCDSFARCENPPLSLGWGQLTPGLGQSGVADFELATWCDLYIDDGSIGDGIVEANLALVVTSCYSGNFLDNFNVETGETELDTVSFSDTSVITASAPEFVTFYGGYHNDAAAALAPGATIGEVHSAGIAGKHPLEAPQSAGPSGKVLGGANRTHVLVWAGLPTGNLTGNRNRDFQDIESILDHWRTVPGSEISVFTDGSVSSLLPVFYPLTDDVNFLEANKENLRTEIQRIGADWQSGDQLILFVTDHGGIASCTWARLAFAAKDTGQSEQIPFLLGRDVLSALADDTGNVPGLEFFTPDRIPEADLPRIQFFLNDTALGTAADFDVTVDSQWINGELLTDYSLFLPEIVIDLEEPTQMLDIVITGKLSEPLKIHGASLSSGGIQKIPALADCNDPIEIELLDSLPILSVIFDSTGEMTTISSGCIPVPACGSLYRIPGNGMEIRAFIESRSRQRISMYTGTCNDPVCGPSGDESIRFLAEKGVDYMIQIETLDPDLPGDFMLMIEEATETRGGLQRPGDCNQDGLLDISDAVCLFGFLFLGDPTRLPCADGSISHSSNVSLADFNGDVTIDLSDGIGVLAFLFAGGPPHALGVDCIRLPECDEICK